MFDLCGVANVEGYSAGVGVAGITGWTAAGCERLEMVVGRTFRGTRPDATGSAGAFLPGDFGDFDRMGVCTGGAKRTGAVVSTTGGKCAIGVMGMLEDRGC